MILGLISDKNKNVHAIDSCGPAANNANIEFYKNHGFSSIPSRGPLSALTVPGAVAGWKLAYDFSVKNLGGKIPINFAHVKAGYCLAEVIEYFELTASE